MRSHMSPWNVAWKAFSGCALRREHPEHSSLSEQESRKGDVASVSREGGERVAPQAADSPSLQMRTDQRVHVEKSPKASQNPGTVEKEHPPELTEPGGMSNFRNRRNTQNFSSVKCLLHTASRPM